MDMTDELPAERRAGLMETEGQRPSSVDTGGVRPRDALRASVRLGTLAVLLLLDVPLVSERLDVTAVLGFCCCCFCVVAPGDRREVGVAVLRPAEDEPLPEAARGGVSS